MMKKRNKTGGRIIGTPNKITLSHRELIQRIFENELNSGKIESELYKLQGKEYLDVILKISGFVLPKLNTVDINGMNNSKPIIIDWREQSQ